jgi:hypothetical protein
MAGNQKLSTELLVRGHTTYGTEHDRVMRLSRVSAYEERSRNLRRAFDILLNQYTNLFVSGGDTRYLRANILAYARILKTKVDLSRKR